VNEVFPGFLRGFLKDNDGQDLADYCLLTALVVLIVAGVFVQMSGGIQSIWGSAGTSFSAAGAMTGGAASTAAASSPSH
jgi:Flp pilus assembly pilin Flp